MTLVCCCVAGVVPAQLRSSSAAARPGAARTGCDGCLCTAGSVGSAAAEQAGAQDTHRQPVLPRHSVLSPTFFYTVRPTLVTCSQAVKV
jgi:hypothetical protein